ncbi:tyrosine-protein phosphatase siw14 [Vermiconidia calcicola]|uniref:Tyrosine-protein phosphatase siw14 n=1 Tax=Vermiconidia calcicola TaxID=1690605 RepID=A0ACC3MZK6_9PEZI|nr:tyrosine-protein phosphatase siw14 [Vermiconidia calcicola]
MRYTSDGAPLGDSYLSSVMMDARMEKMVAQPALEQRQGVDCMVSAEAVEAGLLKAKQDGATKMTREPGSLPPSPPSSGSTTPSLNTGPIPPRLRAYVPPQNYGTVDPQTVFRSSFPQDGNIDFIKSLNVRSVLTLVSTEPTPAYLQWLDDYGVRQLKVDIAANKDGNVNTTKDSLCEALLFAIDSSNHPLYIHCNRGKHRTGCVVACLRKIQGVPMAEIKKEYVAYADKKAREGDLKLIESFEPKDVYDYANTHGYLDGANQQIARLDSTVTDIDSLVAALSSVSVHEFGMQTPISECYAPSSTASDKSDDVLEINMPGSASRMDLDDSMPVEVSVSEVAIDTEMTDDDHLCIRDEDIIYGYDGMTMDAPLFTPEVVKPKV